MLRHLTLFLAAVIPSNAAFVINESVNCGGASQSLTMQWPGPLNPLRCDQNGVTAIAENTIGLLAFQIVAVPSPGNSQTPGNVEASFTESGVLTLTWEGGQINPPQPNPAFWSVCFNSAGSDIRDGGTGTVSGFFGPGTVGGAPCDFAHAVPFPSSGQVTFPVDLTGTAQGNTILELAAQQQFFDANGNLIGPIAFGLTTEVPVPDSFTAIPLSLVLIGVMRRRLNSVGMRRSAAQIRPSRKFGL